MLYVQTDIYPFLKIVETWNKIDYLRIYNIIYTTRRVFIDCQVTLKILAFLVVK